MVILCEGVLWCLGFSCSELGVAGVSALFVHVVAVATEGFVVCKELIVR